MRRRIAELASMLANERATHQQELATVTAERAKLRRQYERLKEQLELLRRRIFVAKAERVDVTQLELEFAAAKRELDALGFPNDAASNDDSDDDGKASNKRRKRGRRDLSKMTVLREDRREPLDESLKAAVREGTVDRIGFTLGRRVARQLCLAPGRTFDHGIRR